MRMKSLWFSLLCGAFGEAMFFPVVRDSTPLDPTLRIAALAFGPVVGLMGFALVSWLDRDCIVEFSCDDTSFRFRKVAATETESRNISDIIKLQAMGRGRTTGYSVGFRDGTEATVSVRMLPDGPLLGQWFQMHLGKTRSEGTPTLSSLADEGWGPPRELRWPAPRRVRFTTGGAALCVITVAVVVGGDEGMLSYARFVETHAAEVQQRIGNSHKTEGVVTRLWKVGVRHTDFLITYRYSAEGTEWNAPSTTIRGRHWRSLQVGAPISILYTPGDPASSFPEEDPPYVPPSWLAWAIMPILTGFGILPFLAIIRARRYLAYGNPAPARVSSVSWRPGTTATVYYQFPMGDGTMREGSYVTGDVPPQEDSVITVLYDPKNPRRNSRYPVGLVRLADK